MKALVTGASGFIGRHIAEKLIRKGHHVRALVRKTSRVEPLTRQGIELAYGDLSDPESLKQAAAGVEIVFHTAAHVGDWGTRKEFYEGNVLGTGRILDALSVARVERLVYLSSVAVYGRPRVDEGFRIPEDFASRKNGDPYCDTKMEAENLVQEYARKNKIAVGIVRPCIVYGPYDFKFIPRIAKNILKGKMMMVGTGDHQAPIVYAGDVADLSILVSERAEAQGEVFNVASNEGITWKQLLTHLAHRLGVNPPTATIPYPVIYFSGAVLEYLWKAARAKKPPLITRFGATLIGGKWAYDTTKADRLLGFRPQVQFGEGISSTLAWMRQEVPSFKLHAASQTASQD